MKILITGAYGIVGSYLTKELKQHNYIIGIGRKDNYDECDKYYSCDITDKAQLEDIIKENNDIDIIIHCAALAHNKGNDLSKDRFMKVNYEATESLVDISNKYLELKNFIFISTISVYGEELNKDKYYEIENCNPKSPYAVAKRKSENYIFDNYKGKYTILRLAPVYSKDFNLNITRRSYVRNIPYKVSKGKNKLSLCNIKNIYEAINYLVNEKEGKNEIYNISDRVVYEFNDLLKYSNTKASIIIPKNIIKGLYCINSMFLKKQFIHENSIKLISDNIYPSDKIDSKIEMKYSLKDV